MVVRAQHTFTLQCFSISLNSFLFLSVSSTSMGMILMGQVVSGVVTNEPMNLIFQTITVSKAGLQVSKNI